MDSRYVLKTDEKMPTFQWEEELWEFDKLQWWSRPYEYAWMFDCCRAFFGEDIKEKTVIDVATGILHPGMFILKKAGFKRVVGTDLYPLSRHQYNQYINGNISYIQEDILNPSSKEKFDCVTCISSLEHFPSSYHEISILNLMAKCKQSNSCIILTFDMPGFEYETNLNLYKTLLSQNNWKYNCIDAADKEILRSIDCNTNEECKQKNLSCYRLFAYK